MFASDGAFVNITEAIVTNSVAKRRAGVVSPNRTDPIRSNAFSRTVATIAGGDTF